MRRVWRFFDRRRRDEDLQEELRAFVDDLTARNVARGMSPETARRAALVETGGVQQVREATREQWMGNEIETVLRDVRYSARLLRRAPGFSIVVIATLALAIGANATVFSVMHAVLWRPLPYPDANRLVVVDADYRGVTGAGISGGESLDLGAEADLFAGLAYVISVDAHVSVDGEMERVPAASATDDALHLLGGAPLALGRPLVNARDNGPETIRSVVISDALWERRLGRDPAVIGRYIEVNNIRAEVVGVLRPDFRVFLPPAAGVPEVVDVWFPTGYAKDRRSRGQITIARLASGTSLQTAQARLDTLAERFVREFPSDYDAGGLRLFATPLQAAMTADVTRTLWVLAGAVAFVLLIACVNVGNLMLARARARQREIAMRRALGAAQSRLVRQLATEVAVLSLLGAALGFALAQGGIALVEWLGPTHLPRQSTIHMNGESAGFTAGVAIMVSVVFSLLPVFGSRGGTLDPLRAGRVAAQGAGMRRMQRAMVVAEVALSIVPLVAAGLMLRSFFNLVTAPVGFRTDHIVTAKLAYSLRDYREYDRKLQLHMLALDRVRQIPGVEDVSAGGPVAFDDWPQTRAYAREGEVPFASRASIQSVMPGFLRVTGTRLIAGREFSDADLQEQRLVVIVDERIASQLWGDGSAVGQRLAYARGAGSILLEVIGVSEAVRVTRVRDDRLPHLFIPYHLFTVEQALMIKTRLDPAVIGPAAKRAVESLGTRRPLYDIRPLASYVTASIGDTRFLMLVLVGFGLASIALAAIGLYGTLSYITSQRTQEFGIRMALGATAWRVLGTVAGEGLALTLIGGVIGFAGALAATGALRGLLYNVTPFDGITLIATAAGVAVVALIAASHPAWRASQVDPTSALRAE